jgi:hypothetical protein
LIAGYCGLFSCFAQSFSISPPTLSNGTVVINFPTRLDSYYFLQSSPSLSEPVSPASALLGSGDFSLFQPAVNSYGAMFFQVEQFPLTGTNSYEQDGVADGWKLQHGLNPLVSGVANELATGYATTWLQVYKTQTNLAALPLAYFPNSSSTVVVGSTNTSIQVAFSKPYTGWLTYQLSGTAVPASSGVTGDYIQPAGEVYVGNATTANILITLVPESDIEIDRSIVIALSAPPITNQTYTIITNSCVATVQIVQSALGVFVGNLAITNGLFASSQSVKLALRPGAGTSTVALLDVTGNALLGNTFSVPVNASASGFQLSGGLFTNLVTSTPWGRNLNVSLSFGATQTNGTTFTTPVTLSLTGLTASGVSYAGSGILNLARSQ